MQKLTKIFFVVILIGLISNINNITAQTKIENGGLKYVNPKDLQPIDINTIDKDLHWLLPIENTKDNIDNSKKEYWQKNKLGKGSGWKPYQRAKAFWETRSSASIKDISNLYKETFSRNSDKIDKIQDENEWTFLGPSLKPRHSSEKDPTGMGRVNCLTFDPVNPNIIWAGAAFGGVWRSTNGGGDWTTFPFTQFLSIGITDIAVAKGKSPRSEIVYAATGDADAAFGGISCYTIGVIKTTDFGETWSTTNFTSQISDRTLINRLLVDPNDENRVFAATNRGLFMTENGGESWDTLTNAYTRDLEFVPGDYDRLWAAFIYGDGTNTLYGLYKVQVFQKEGRDSSAFYGTPIAYQYGEVIRMAITVNEDNPNYIYVLNCTHDGSLHSVIYSPDGDQQWFYMAQTLDNSVGNYTWDLLNARSDMPDSINSSSQGFYDLCIAANPDDPMEVYIGGVNIWKFRENNQPWQLFAHWTTRYEDIGISYVHADHHDLKFNQDGVLYSANDGGVNKFNDKSMVWDDLSEGLEITQFYRINSSQKDPSMVIAGSQDNGTSLLMNKNWFYVRGGDGMDCQIDPFDDNVVYNSIYYGDFWVSRDRGDSFQPLIDTTVTGESAAWVTPFTIDPVIPDNIYVGYENLWRATRKGQEPFQRISNFEDKDPIRHIAISRKDNKVIYIIKPRGIYRTTNQGQEWESIVTGNGDIAMTSIAIDPEDPLHIWISRGAFVEGEKVFEYINNTLYVYSPGLPNVPANHIVHNANSNNNQLFLATDVGVFFIDENMTEWESYGFGLPNVVVQDLDINYKAGKIRAATFGRGLWEAKIVDCVIDPPDVHLSGDRKLCEGDTITLSVEDIYVSYEWNTGETSASITVTDGGLFFVQVKDENGCVATSDEITVTMINPPDVKVKSQSGETVFCELDSLKLVASPTLNFETFNWSNGMTGKSIFVKESGTYTATGVTREGCTKAALDTITLTTIPAPPKPTITVDGEMLTCSEADSYEWFLDGESIFGADEQTIKARKNGNYSVVVTNDEGCQNISDEVYVEVVSVENQDVRDVAVSLQPNPANSAVTITIQSNLNMPITININDLLGNEVYSNEFSNSNGNLNQQIDISSWSTGTYLVNIQIADRKLIRKLIKYE